MITRVALLFLLGTTMSSGRLMSKLRSLPYEKSGIPSAQTSGCPAASELAPLICKLIQQNIALYYKPQLIKPSTYIPPVVVEKCETPELQMEIELPEPVSEKKPLVIPQPPELPLITIPQFPIPMVIQEPPPSAEPCKSSAISEMPAVNIPVAPGLPSIQLPTLPEIVEQPEPYYTPIEIPQPPELPMFTMPELPVIYEQEQPIIAPPCHEDEPTPEVPAIIQPVVTIPAAPELPAASLPEFPIHFDIPSGPVLPSMSIPSSTIISEQDIPCLDEVNPTEVDYNTVEYQPISVPQPPELPAFVMPDLPVLFMEQELPTIAEPCLDDQPAPIVSTPEFIQPVSIPQPPELPAFVMPEFPVQIVEQEPPMAAAPCPEDQPAPIVTIPEFVRPLPSFPAAPELPPAKLPEFPVHLEIPTEPVLPSLEIPSPPIFFEQPKEPCLTEELVAPQPEPIVIPEAPKLPELIMPDFPLKFTIDEPAYPQPTFISEPCESSGKPVVQIATIPNTYFERNFPSYGSINNEKINESQKVLIPSKPIDPNFFPARCVYNLVMEHVIPNIASDRFRSLENIEVLPPSILPCS